MAKTAIITGASRGIGRAIALKFGEEGYNLALFGRDSSKLSAVREEVGAKGISALIFTGDVSDEEFVRKSVHETENKFGQIDVLVNNAGAAVFHKFTETSLEDFKLQMNANVYGVFNFCRAVIHGMIENDSGTIINVSSIAGKNGFVGGTTYAATKHAVMGLTKSLHLEVRKFNIRVAAVCPGSVNTEMIVGSEMQPKNLDKVLQPNEIADAVYLIARLPQTALINELEIRPTNP